MKVKFWLSTGYVNATREEEFDLEDLTGCTEEEWQALDPQEQDSIIQECFDDWLANYDMGWHVE